MQHEGLRQVVGLADDVFDIGAVVADRTVDVGARAHEEAHLAAQAIADRADLSVPALDPAQVVHGLFHVPGAQVVVEPVVAVERRHPVVRVVGIEDHVRPQPPEQVGHEADIARLGEFVGVRLHRVVDAPDLHDRDDRPRRGLVRIGDIGAHLAIAELDLDLFRAHRSVSPLSSLRCAERPFNTINSMPHHRAVS